MPAKGSRSAAAQKRAPPPKMTKEQRAEATARIDAEIAAGKRAPRTKEKVEDPYVVVDWNRHTAIVIHRAVDYVYHVEHNGKYIHIQRSQLVYFDKMYKPLHLPGDLPYPVQKAARKFLEWSEYAGITDAAKRVITNLLSNRELDMSNVAQETAAQSDVAPPAPAEKVVKEAAVKVAKGGSTKNGTTAAAKRPSKAKAVDPATVQAIQDAAKKATSTKSADADTTQMKESAVKKSTKKVATKKATSDKPEAASKKASSAKPTAGKKQAAPAAKTKPVKKTTADTGRAPSIPDNYIIAKVVENPKREGTDAYTKFSKYKVGMTVGQVLAKNVDRADMNYNVKRGFVTVKKPAK